MRRTDRVFVPVAFAAALAGLSACGACGKGSEPEHTPPEVPQRPVGTVVGKAIKTTLSEDAVPRILAVEGGAPLGAPAPSP